jgi:hypothetical protein
VTFQSVFIAVVASLNLAVRHITQTNRSFVTLASLVGGKDTHRLNVSTQVTQFSRLRRKGSACGKLGLFHFIDFRTIWNEKHLFIFDREE